MGTIKQNYEEAVNDYTALFMAKHDLRECDWIRDNVGTTCSIGDYFIDFNDIRFDIDNHCEKNLFFEWYDETLALAITGDSVINYENWCKM